MNQVEAYWQRFLASLPTDDPTRRQSYVAEPFGDSPDLADSLAALVLDGVKTATCSALWEWEAEGNPLPEVGLKTIVLGGDDLPKCIIETTEVTILPYREVDAQFAADEGEGDRSLDYWRTTHWTYFSRTLARIGKVPAPEMPLVCERFRVIYA
jgi:uncharacterized protein YhfF